LLRPDFVTVLRQARQQALKLPGVLERRATASLTA
jgi:hypothetical protein